MSRKDQYAGDMARDEVFHTVLDGLARYTGEPFVAEVAYPGGELVYKLRYIDQSALYRVDWYPDLYQLGWRTPVNGR